MQDAGAKALRRGPEPESGICATFCSERRGLFLCSPLPLFLLSRTPCGLEMSSIAAACARSSRALPARRAARAFATEAFTAGSSSSPAGVPPPRDTIDTSKRRKRIPNVTDHDGKSIYVRAWDDISTMPEFFAILRGVEKRFGTVREFRVSRVSS